MRLTDAVPGRSSPAGLRLRVFAVVATTALLFVLTSRREFFYDSDTSTYLELARSLAQGLGYTFDGGAHTKFPPGVPLLLVPFVRASDGDFALLYRCSAAISIAALLCAWWWFRERGERHPLLLLCLCAASAAWYEFSTGASLSEAPFALVMLAAFATAERLARRRMPSWPLTLGLAGLVLAAMLLRSAGLALLLGALATCLHLRVRRARADPAAMSAGRLAAVLVPAALWFAAWTWWSQAGANLVHAGDLGHRGSYVALWALEDPHNPDLGPLTLPSFIGRALQKLLMEGRHVAEVLSNLRWLPREVPSPLLVFSLLLCGLGLRAELRRRNPLVGWVALAYAALIVLWPYDEGRRFVMPFVPVIFVLATAGLGEASEIWRRTPARRLGRVLLTISLLCAAWTAIALRSSDVPVGLQGRVGLLLWVLAALFGILLMRSRMPRAPGLPRSRFALIAFLIAYTILGAMTIRSLASRNLVLAGEPMRQSAAQLACAWILQNTPADARIMATDYAAIRYATGRSVQLLPITADPALIMKAIDAARPDFVVINAPRPGEYFLPTEYQRLNVLKKLLPGSLERVARTPRGSIWRVAR